MLFLSVNRSSVTSIGQIEAQRFMAWYKWLLPMCLNWQLSLSEHFTYRWYEFSFQECCMVSEHNTLSLRDTDRLTDMVW